MSFKKGVSGNPSGRPAGRPDRRTKLRALIEPSAPELIQAAITAAMGGDGQMMKLILDRILPPLKPDSEAVPVQVDLSGSPIEQSQEILKGVSDGLISIENAVNLLMGISVSMKIREISELEQRLEALETELSQRGIR